ncbi:MAG: type II toxin-antitoxin system RelE/ParE family toxin [Rhizomicrobium sp.]
MQVWTVEVAAEFESELSALSADVRIELLAQAHVIEVFGPKAGRPRVDTLKGSKHANMKELRFDAGGGVWRVAFAFDPERKAILLIAGDKSGQSQRTFYRRLIATADKRFDAHLVRLKTRKMGK